MLGNKYKLITKLEYKESTILGKRSYPSGWEKIRDGIGVFFNGIFLKLQIQNEINSRIYIEPIKWYEKCDNYMEYEAARNDANNFLPYVYHPGNIKEEFEKQYRIYEMGERKGAEILDESLANETTYSNEEFEVIINILNKNIKHVELR